MSDESKIESWQQYKRTLCHLQNFKDELARHEQQKNPPPDVHEIVWKAVKDGLRSKIEDLETQLAEFERTKDED